MELPLSTNSVPCAFFLRVAIGCRLSLKIDRNYGGALIGGYMIWFAVNRRYGIWIEYLYRSVDLLKSVVWPCVRSTAACVQHRVQLVQAVVVDQHHGTVAVSAVVDHPRGRGQSWHRGSALSQDRLWQVCCDCYVSHDVCRVWSESDHLYRS